MRACSPDARVFRNIFSRSDYDLPTDAMGEVRTIIDLGAYCGLSTVYFAERFPGASIVAVEPDPANYNCLRLNASTIPQAERVRILQLAVSDASGSARFSDRGTQWARRIDPEGTLTVHTMTMPDLLAASGFDTVDLLKVDIEGAERILLEGLSEWESRCRWVLMELHFEAVSLVAALDFLRARGRNQVMLKEPGERWADLERSQIPLLQLSEPAIEILVPPPSIP